MSQSGHRSQSRNTMASAAEQEAAQRARYMAHMERRARPPTFRPLTIVVVVLAAGLFVIGLIMIVIAHWPGVSGGDSLKIAGGCLMAAGGVVLIIAISVTCVLRNQEQERFEKSIASIAASRSSHPYSQLNLQKQPQYPLHLQQTWQKQGNASLTSGQVNRAHHPRSHHSSYGQTTPTPSVDAKPGKSILKKTPSTSTYGTNRGSVFGEDDSGVQNNNSFGQNNSYDRSSDSSGKYEVYRIETMPDPSKKMGGRNGALPQIPGANGAGQRLSGSGLVGSGMLEQSSTDSEAQHLPTPVRNTKKKRGQSPSVASGHQNTSYMADSQNVYHNTSVTTQEVPRAAEPIDRHSYNNAGYHAHDGEMEPPRPVRSRQRKEGRKTTTPSTGGSLDDSEERERRRERRAKKAAEAPQANVDLGAGLTGAGLAGPGLGMAGYGDNSFQNESFAPQEADLGYAQPPPANVQTVTTTTTTKKTRRVKKSAPSGHNTSQQSMDDELRINIKAEPGTAVHITPTGTRKFQHQARTAASPSQSSVETEI